MDDAERAADLEEETRAHALKRQVELRHAATPASECEDCDAELLPHRQPYGTCIDCQTARELRDRHHRRDRT